MMGRGFVAVAATLFLALFTKIQSAQAGDPPGVMDYLLQIEELLDTEDSNYYVVVLDEVLLVPTSELHELVIKKIEQIIGFLDPNDEQVVHINDMIRANLAALTVLGSKKDTELLAELSRWVNLTLADSELEEEILRTALQLKSVDSRRLVSIEKIGTRSNSVEAIKAEASARRSFETAIRRATSLVEKMQQRVIEQDEAIQAFQTIYLQDLISNHQREKPEILYLMGLPGAGKDSIVKAYIDALWDKPGAYKDHVFRMTIKTKQEAWSYFGSAKGFVGSNELPAFLRFLVQHSGGKYVLRQTTTMTGSAQTIIEKNPDWDGKFKGTTPDRAIIFVNEAHNIPKEVKDNLLKEAIGDGIFPITNPGNTPNSVDHLELPMTFVFASNEGIGLLEPREKNGARMGEPLSFEELLRNHQQVYQDKPRLKLAQIEHYGEKNDRVDPSSPGVSEEFLSRIPNNRLILLKPISPDGLKKIARLFEKELTDQLRRSNTAFGPFDLVLTEELIEFLTTHQLIPSDGARPLEDRLKSIVFSTFYQAVLSGKIKPSGKRIAIEIDLKSYENSAKSLVFRVFEGRRSEEIDGLPPSYQFTRLVRDSLTNLSLPPLSDAEIARFMDLKSEISANVFGVDHIVDRLVEAVIISEAEARNPDASRGATVMAFLGKTSTGKTETAKQFVYARYGKQARPTVIDFNGVRDLQSLKAKILGTVDSRNNPIASDFMKAYDRANGKIAFIFDEAANAPKELLKGLFEILREATATGFSDGKPRSMRNVTIMLTGNAGEEIYQSISPELSTRRYSQAMEEVFRIFLKNEALQNRILTETFPDALLARIGRNIFHFGPLTHKSKRQIAQLKLTQGLKRLEPKPGERGWYIRFHSEEDLLQVFQMIEVEGYSQSYQGASIDKFVREAIIDAIKVKLLTSGFPNGSHIVLSVGEFIEPDDPLSPPFRTLTLASEMGQELEVVVPLQRWVKELPQSVDQRLLVVYHEVGHEIVSHYYFHEFVEPTLLKILPGVTFMDKELVAYEGIRNGLQNQKIDTHKELVLRRVAVLVGGYIAEQLVTLGARHGAGKSNDIKRATDLIHQAILRWGLSDDWDKQAIPASISTSDYISKHLSEREKERLHSLTQKWLTEAEEMARTAILSNFNGAFYSISKALAEKGELNGEEIKKIYADQSFVYNADQATFEGFDPIEAFNRFKTIIESHRDLLVNQHSIEQVYQDPHFYKNRYNEIMRAEAGWFNRLILGRYPRWRELPDLERMIFKAALSSIFDDKSLQPKLADGRWRMELVIDPEDILKAQEEKQKEGVLEIGRFVVHSSGDLTPSQKSSRPISSSTCFELITSI